MAGSSAHRDADGDSGARVGTPAPTTPRWAKVLGIIVVVLVVLLLVQLLIGRGGHGPGRHATSLAVTEALLATGQDPRARVPLVALPVARGGGRA